MRDWFRPSGGLLYHWRALRQRGRWRPFAQSLADWLADWPQPREELILIGPSGGYSLPDAWLNSFTKIYAYDLDPLAPFCFHRRHPQAKIRFYKQDMFWDKSACLSLDALDRVLSEHPPAAVLFCNVLGQVLLEHATVERDWVKFLNTLRVRLENRSWRSYHDVYTVEPLPPGDHARIAQAADLRRALSDTRAERVEVVDHLMDHEWSAGLVKARFGWSLTEESLHIIEGVAGPN